MGSREDNNFLKRVSVASPCSASWDAMTGDDKVRLCGQCDRNIYNLESMSAAESAALLRNSTTQTCVRMFRRADGTLMTNDCPTGLRMYRKRVGLMASAAFAMLLGMVSLGTAQRIPSGDSTGARSETSIEIPFIEGTVRDPNGEIIERAKVTVTTPTGRKIVTQTNRKGYFRIMHSRMLGGGNSVKIDALGFKSFGDSFTIVRRESIDFSVILEIGSIVGVVTVDSPPMIDRKKTSISTRIILNRH